MTVYVDDMYAKYGSMTMCHMVADTEEELHEMAKRIDVNRRWHQAPPKHDSHYDICLSKRALAVKHGAVEITWNQLGTMVMHRRVTGRLGTPEEAMEWRKQRAAARKA